MGILIEVYRNSFGDCTMNGVSSRENTLNAVNVDGPFIPDVNDENVVILEKGPMNSARLFPAAYNAENERWEALKGGRMFGGNYGASCDGRFVDAVKGITNSRQDIVKIFDRKE